ncbi:MAG: rRNA maturation RNase YbeY [Salaquimonas sp.]
MTLPQIDINIENGDWPVEKALGTLIAKAITTVASEAKLIWPTNAELSVLFTDDVHMAKINGQWRNKPKPTNVLSFPGADIEIGEPSDILIGDLVFALETVKQEAETQDKTFDDHLSHLIVHGFLHLFGYDHIETDDAEQMEAIETAALAKLGINDPYTGM